MFYSFAYLFGRVIEELVKVLEVGTDHRANDARVIC